MVFAQSVDENIGGAVNNYAQGANNTGELVLIATLLFVGVMVSFIVIMVLVRRKLPKADRKTKVVKLP